MRLFSLFLLVLPLVARAQAPPTHPYADPVRRRIGTAQDERRTADLLPFLTDKNPAYRAAAAEALASVQDRAAVPALLERLHDGPAVQQAAAYALGQLGDSTAAEPLAHWTMRSAGNYATEKALFEALGRCVTRTSLPLVWRIKLLPPSPDTLISAGVAWGIYRAMVRGLATAEAVQQATKLLSQPHAPLAARRGASAALTRMRGQDSTLARVALPVLLKGLGNDPDYFVRANCATALGRVARPVALGALLRSATDVDSRVRIAALRALPIISPAKVGVEDRRGPTIEAVFSKAIAPCAQRSLEALLKPVAQEALVGAEWFLKAPLDTGYSVFVRNSYTNELINFAASTPHFRARATLLQAALRHGPAAQRPAVADTIRRRYQRTTNQYEKAALLTALSEDPAQFDFLAREAMQTAGPPVVPGTALAALVALRGNKDFPAARQADFVATLRRTLARGDVAQLSTAAEAYADPKLVPATQAADLDALRQARDKLVLPGEIEPWIALQQTLDKLAHAPTPTAIHRGTASQHPIDWEEVQRVPVGQRVRLTTTQGPIELELLVAEAPGAVANFALLVRKHFYDGLYFHRVVPNFVAQGGDPRGDGSGSTPYTLRSELAPLTYGAGAVGLASAGKDTESCQFFITHLPTPHLDGRYPIFARVVSGLEVVQRLDVGDRILTATLLAASPVPARASQKK